MDDTVIQKKQRPFFQKYIRHGVTGFGCIVCIPLHASSPKSALTIALLTPEYITEEKYYGGLANYVHRAAISLRELGHNPHVIVSSVHGNSIVDDGIPVHRVQIWDGEAWRCEGRVFSYLNRRTKGKYNKGLGFLRQSYALNRALKRLHKQHRFDVVQYPQLGGIGVFRPWRIPAVMRLSSLASLWTKHGGFGESEHEMKQQEFMELLSLKRADAIFGPSKQIANYVSEKVKKQIAIIESPYVMDVSEIDDAVYQENFAGKKYLLFFGSIGLIKGAGTIAEVIDQILSRDPTLYFVFVGKRLQRQEGGDLIERIRNNAGSQEHRVLWHDTLRHEQLYPIIKHAHTVVLPSRIDNFPNACIEAMAHCKVVIGTKGNGFEQLIEHGKSGLLCNPDDPADLLRVTDLALLLTDEERQTIGANAKERIEQLSPQHAGKQLVEFYTSVLKRS